MVLPWHGVERIAMLKYGIDIRLYSKTMWFLKQFSSQGDVYASKL